MWWLWLIYGVALTLIALFSLKLTTYSDILVRKTNIKAELLAGVVLAFITALPELITAISSVFFINEEDIVLNNILGSNLFNIAGLGVAMMIFAPIVCRRKVTKSSGVFLMIGIVLTLCVFLNSFLPENTLVIPFFNINSISFIIIACYILGVIFAQKETIAPMDDAVMQDCNLTVKQTVRRFVICSLGLLVVGIALNIIGYQLTLEYNTSNGIMGAVFLCVGNCLSLFITTLQFMRLGNFNMALTVVTGTNVFIMLILVLMDVFFFGGTIFIQEKHTSIMSGLLIISNLLLMLLWFGKIRHKVLFNEKFVFYVLGVLLIIPYICYIIYSTILF